MIILIYSWVNDVYLDMKYGVLPLFSVVLSMLGIGITLTFSKLIEHLPISRILVYLGRNTLVIMAVHMFFMAIAADYVKPSLSRTLYGMLAYKIIQQIIMWAGVLATIWLVNNKAKWILGK